jgi:hypothetical protein
MCGAAIRKLENPRKLLRMWDRDRNQMENNRCTDDLLWDTHSEKPLPPAA